MISEDMFFFFFFSIFSYSQTNTFNEQDWFQRGILKCEKFTDDGCRAINDNSSHDHFGSDELIKNHIFFYIKIHHSELLLSIQYIKLIFKL